MSAGNYGGASSMGGGGNMSGQEWRGGGGLLGHGGRSTVGGLAGMQEQSREEANLRRLLEEMGIDPETLGGGGGRRNPRSPRAASSEPPAWKFPQYTQSWLPAAPPVPPRVPTPPFVRS